MKKIATFATIVYIGLQICSPYLDIGAFHIGKWIIVHIVENMKWSNEAEVVAMYIVAILTSVWTALSVLKAFKTIRKNTARLKWIWMKFKSIFG